MATVTFSADGVQVTNRLSVLKVWLISGEQPEPGVTDISDYGDLFIPSCYEEGDIPVWAMYANKFYPATVILEPGTYAHMYCIINVFYLSLRNKSIIHPVHKVYVPLIHFRLYVCEPVHLSICQNPAHQPAIWICLSGVTSNMFICSLEMYTLFFYKKQVYRKPGLNWQKI